MSRLVNPNKVHAIDLENGEWIEVRAGLSFREFMELSKLDLEKNPENMIDFLARIITSWNLLDSEGKPQAYEEELLGDLDLDTVSFVVQESMKLYTPKKKGEQLKES